MPDAEELADLSADVWASAWYSRNDLPENTGEHGDWFVSHARQVAAIWMKSRRHADRIRSAAKNQDEFDAPSTGLPDEVRFEICRVCLRQWMTELPARQYYAVWLRGLFGFSFIDVGSAMNCSPSAAKTHYKRGQEYLRWRASHSGLSLEGM